MTPTPTRGPEELPSVPAHPRRPGRTRRLQAAALGVLAALLVPGVLEAAPDGAAPSAFGSQLQNPSRVAPVARAATDDSARTLRGRGEFADLEVTVGQTADLVNQSIAVSWRWRGDDPEKRATKDGPGDVRANFLQIMQCWGDGAPDRTQCVFGGLNPSAGLTNSASRQIFPPSAPANPNSPIDEADEDITPEDGDYAFPSAGGYQFQVPFRAVTGEVVKHADLATNPFYGQFDTNEIPYAVTRPDGRGFETFETQTYRESAGLGCGDIITSGPRTGQPRSCWLVVVPRGETDADGRPFREAFGERLQSSPLSGSNWKNRIVFPLGFSPVGQPCPITARQRQVGGVETATEAVLRWQPALCRSGGTVYGYTQLSESVVENGLTGPDAGTAGLGFLNAPVLPADVPADRSLVYAPIAVSGVAIAALVERLPSSAAPPEVRQRQGERITDIRLTPRLVAKLLTQSYQAGVNTRADLVPGYISGNPVNIDTDPEFLAINPEFKQLNQFRIQLLMPTGVSSTNELLWRWIASDQSARDFVAGLPDEHGMRVNPFYQSLDIPQQTLPKIDPYCQRDPAPSELGTYPALCVFDLHPAVQDFRESARLASRGDTQAIEWGPDVKATPLKRVARPVPGARQILGITDTPTAARYELPTVKLRNGAGVFVAPTTETMQAAVASMLPTAVPGVTVADPESANRNAYPLTTVTYAAAAPNQLTAEAARDYADFVRYAAGPGQTPGSGAGRLPEGYAPLTAGMRRQALKAAADIQARVGPAVARPPATRPPATRSPSAPTGGGSAPGTGSGPAAGAPVVPPPPAPASTSPAPPAVAAPPLKPAASRTPADKVVQAIARYAFVIALVLALSGLILAPLLPRIARRLGR